MLVNPSFDVLPPPYLAPDQRVVRRWPVRTLRELTDAAGFGPPPVRPQTTKAWVWF
jgi:hypothetical protein